jgi:hypothetical protein
MLQAVQNTLKAFMMKDFVHRSSGRSYGLFGWMPDRNDGDWF